jgi:hypothetical protein
MMFVDGGISPCYAPNQASLKILKNSSRKKSILSMNNNANKFIQK